MSLTNAKQGADDGRGEILNIRNISLTLKSANTVDEMFT